MTKKLIPLNNDNYRVENLILEHEGLEVDIKQIDKRTITTEQRNFIFALCETIGYHLNLDKDYVRLTLSYAFATNKGIEVCSLSNCLIGYATEFIDYIIIYAIEREIPLSDNLMKRNGYTYTYKQIYMFALKRSCPLCGKRASLYELSDSVIPLCEFHKERLESDKEFLTTNKLFGIRVDTKLKYFINKGVIKTWDS
jgi:hypothetical protein